MRSIGDILHQRGRGTPGFIVCSFPDLTCVSIGSYNPLVSILRNAMFVRAEVGDCIRTLDSISV
jgi:hypothetical protein